ncbi:MAG TPA: hypothetical protein VEC36_04960 [Patescibacteria group bacterium]|nr:hypothetical protein [Patescibacteria group bacterium]
MMFPSLRNSNQQWAVTLAVPTAVLKGFLKRIVSKRIVIPAKAGIHLQSSKVRARHCERSAAIANTLNASNCLRDCHVAGDCSSQ